MPKKSPALQHVQHVWSNTRIRGSYQRLNTAMYLALKNAIEADLEFHEADLDKMPGIGRWLTAGGENLYALACGSERGILNASAAAAFEKMYGRKVWLWAEETKTPGRLFIGSQFTWEGELVTVTSFNDTKQTLVACSYKDAHRFMSDDEAKKAGDLVYFKSAYRSLEVYREDKDGTICARFSPPTHNNERVIARRFTITHAELTAKRKEYDARRRKFEKQIAGAATLAELDAIGQSVSAEGQHAYRHFDLDILREALKERREQIKENQSAAEAAAYELARDQEYARLLERWVAGEAVTLPLKAVPTIRVRIVRNRVEVSNGNSVTLSGAKKALAFVLKHRAKGWSENGETFDVDAFKVNRIHPADGVTIGCTHFDWPEIERFQSLINS